VRREYWNLEFTFLSVSLQFNSCLDEKKSTERLDRERGCARIAVFAPFRAFRVPKFFPPDRELYQRQIDATDAQIDALVASRELPQGADRKRIYY